MAKNEIIKHCQDRGIKAAYCGKAHRWHFSIKGKALNMASLRNLRKIFGLSIAQAPSWGGIK